MAATSTPVLIHGDAAFAGQGVFAETSTWPISSVFRGRNDHIIVNNLIGFTPPPATSILPFGLRLGQAQPFPYFHVNAEDVDASSRRPHRREYRTSFTATSSST